MQKFTMWLDFSRVSKTNRRHRSDPWSVTSSLSNVIAGISDSLSGRCDILAILSVIANKKRPFLNQLNTFLITLKESESIRMRKNNLQKNSLAFITQI